MANVRIALGGEFDIASGEEMAKGFNDVKRSWRDAMRRPKPIHRPLVKSTDASMVVPTALGQSLVLTIGRPQSGRIWNITRVMVIGDDDTTAAMNIAAALYIGDSANVGLGQCVRHGQAVPWTTTENEKAYIVHDREDLFLRIVATGAATAKSFTATVTAWEYADDAFDAQAI